MWLYKGRPEREMLVMRESLRLAVSVFCLSWLPSKLDSLPWDGARQSRELA